jgi:hypothetical protein
MLNFDLEVYSTENELPYKTSAHVSDSDAIFIGAYQIHLANDDPG